MSGLCNSAKYSDGDEFLRFYIRYIVKSVAVINGLERTLKNNREF